MSGPGPRPTCACPRLDPRACVRVRYNTFASGDADYYGPGDDDECECACHESAEDDDLGPAAMKCDVCNGTGIVWALFAGMTDEAVPCAACRAPMNFASAVVTPCSLALDSTPRSEGESEPRLPSPVRHESGEPFPTKCPRCQGVPRKHRCEFCNGTGIHPWRYPDAP